MVDVSWSSLGAVITGEVVVAGSADFGARSKAFNARFADVVPQAVVRCATPGDVAETLSFARRHEVPVAVRSGGHCFAGRSSTLGVVVDVSPMDSVVVADGLAVVGAGARLGQVYDALGRRGLAIPGGTCPSVGIAGLVLGGGLGLLGRTYGVTSDRLVGAQAVLADGRIVECDDQHHEDLFWALRGGGAGSVGVVTSLVLRPVPARPATNLHLAWPYAAAGAVIAAWQRWAPHGPDRLAASLKITTTDDVDAPPSVDVYLALFDDDPPGDLDVGAGAADLADTADPAGAGELVDRLVAGVGAEPTSVTGGHMSFGATRRYWAQLGVERDDRPQDPSVPVPTYLVARSEFFRRPLPPAAIDALVATFTRGRRAGETRELDFMPWGGAYDRVPPDATAFVHRDELFQVKHAAVVAPDASTSHKRAAEAWVTASWRTVGPWGSGRVFPNFADPDLEDPGRAYFGPNDARLRRIRQHYDPDGFFGDP
jgi:FAD/FMN-containing dehydrogenase